MQTFLPRTSLPLAAVVLAIAAAAQDATAPARGSSRSLPAQLVPVHTAAPDQGTPYGVWAAGADYKASFHDGMVWIPYLGSAYPETVEFAWRTASVAIGGVELATRAQGAPRHTDWRVEYDLGGVVEAYDVRAEGLEQTFVIASRPATVNGDLVIRGKLRTQLALGDSIAAHQDLVFADRNGTPILVYGKATALDAAGNARPMTTRCADGEIELRLDAAWLESAVFPLVVDPLLGPTTVSSGTGNVTAVDMIRDDENSTNNVWQAHVRAVSAADSDLFARRFDDDGANSTLFFNDINAGWSNESPTVTLNAAANRSLVAFTRVFATGEQRVRYHWHDYADVSSNTTVIGITPPANAFYWRPSLGGTRFAGSGSQVLLVVQRETTAGTWADSTTSEIAGCLIDLAGGVTTGSFFTIADVALTEYERPAVNPMCFDSTQGKWLVAYQRRVTFVIGGTSQWDLLVQQVDATGAVSSPLVVNDTATDTQHEFAPRIAGGSDDRYLVAFANSSTTQAPSAPTGSVGHAIRVARIDWPGQVRPGSQPWTSFTLNSNVDARVEVAGLSFDHDTRSHWGVLYRSTATQSIYLRTVGFRGRFLVHEQVADPPVGSASASGAAFYDDDNDRHMVLYAENDLVRLDRFEYASAAVAGSSGISCSAATIDWLGSQQIGSEFGRIVVNGAPANCIQFLALALATASQPLVGIPGIHSGCWLLIPNSGPGYLGTLDFRIGSNAAWNLPLPEFLGNDTLYAQGFHTDSTLSEIFTTQRLTVNVVKD